MLEEACAALRGSSSANLRIDVKTILRHACAAAGIAAVASIAPVLPSAQAQTASSSAAGLEEIVVTARKREESLQDTPVAVSALTGAALETRAVQSVDAVSQFVPNLQFDSTAALSGGAYNATIFIRGIGQNDFAIFSDPGVAMYVDGVYLGRSIGGVMDVLDMERIEVLRGPQGTLFGRNTIGGAVNIVSAQPTEEFGGSVTLTGGNLGRLDAKAVLNAPLSDKLLTRWMIATINRDGYAKRLIDGTELGDKNTDVARVQALLKATDNLQIGVIVDASRTRQHSAPLTLIDVAPAGFPFMNIYNAIVAPTLGITAPNGQQTVNRSFITGDIDTTYATGPSVNNLDTLGVSLTIDWDLGAVGLKSISAYRELEALFARDGDGTPFTFRETINDDEQTQFSQEFQLSGESFDQRLNWLIGAYYFDEKAKEFGKANLAIGTFAALEALPAAQTFPPGPPATFGGAGNPANRGVDVGVDLYTAVKNTSYALFTQSTLQLSEQWSATAGVRWTRDEKEMELTHRREASNVFIVGPNRVLAKTWSEVTPKLGVEFKINPDMMLYVSYSNGYKSGGFNGRPLRGVEAELAPYNPEVVTSYELGFKSAWLDNRLTANLAVFQNDYEDMQLSINATPDNFVRNAGKAEIQGAELEVVTRLMRGLDINLSAGYLNAKYTQLDAQLTTLNPSVTLSKQLVKAPKWTGSAGIQYGVDVGDAGAIVARADYSYKTKVYHDVFNDERLSQDAFGLINAYLSYALNDALEFGVFGTNLADKRYKISGNSSLGFGLAEATYSAPREYGVKAVYKF